MRTPNRAAAKWMYERLMENRGDLKEAYDGMKREGVTMITVREIEDKFYEKRWRVEP